MYLQNGYEVRGVRVADEAHAERKVSDKSIINIINSLWKKNNPEYWKKGNRAESVFKLACLMCKWGVDEKPGYRVFH